VHPSPKRWEHTKYFCKKVYHTNKPKSTFPSKSTSQEWLKNQNQVGGKTDLKQEWPNGNPHYSDTWVDSALLLIYTGFRIKNTPHGWRQQNEKGGKHSCAPRNTWEHHPGDMVHATSAACPL